MSIIFETTKEQRKEIAEHCFETYKVRNKQCKGCSLDGYCPYITQSKPMVNHKR